ncbi:MAG TPA: hypothetical protein VJ642_00555, partial [Chromobacteriaceae bacterium]|nr:hypothetical protein [Chromobacteriaceae bacterium]
LSASSKLAMAVKAAKALMLLSKSAHPTGSNEDQKRSANLKRQGWPKFQRLKHIWIEKYITSIKKYSGE